MHPSNPRREARLGHTHKIPALHGSLAPQHCLTKQEGIKKNKPCLALQSLHNVATAGQGQNCQLCLGSKQAKCSTPHNRSNQDKTKFLACCHSPLPPKTAGGRQSSSAGVGRGTACALKVGKANPILKPHSLVSDWLSAKSSSREQRAPQGHCWVYHTDPSTSHKYCFVAPPAFIGQSKLPRLALEEQERSFLAMLQFECPRWTESPLITSA